MSKQYLRGEAEPGSVFVNEEGLYGGHDIELRLGRTASALDTTTRTLQLDDGDRLLLATGAEPCRLDLPGADLDGIHYLRSLADADALHDAFERGGRLVVIGAGWIGCEIAASAHQSGLEVTLIAPDQLPLAKILGDEIGAVYRDLHAEHGVTWRLGQHVAALEGAGPEHWATALNQGGAAQGMLGQSASFDKLPFLYSDQYDTGMEYSGHPRTWDTVVFRGDPACRKFIAFWRQDGRVVAGMNMNIWDVNGALQDLIRSRVVVDESRLTGSDIPLDQLGKTATV